MFYNVLARRGFSFCNRARLNFQAFALRDMRMAAQEACRVGQNSELLPLRQKGTNMASPYQAL